MVSFSKYLLAFWVVVVVVFVCPSLQNTAREHKKAFFAWCLVGEQQEKQILEQEREGDAWAIACHNHQISSFRILEWDFDTKSAN